MQDLDIQARFESDFAVELADSLNEELESTDYVFIYNVHGSVYLAKEVDEGEWTYEGEFEDTGGPLHEATDKMAGELGDNWRVVDIPGTNESRSLYTVED